MEGGRARLGSNKTGAEPSNSGRAFPSVLFRRSVRSADRRLCSMYLFTLTPLPAAAINSCCVWTALRDFTTVLQYNAAGLCRDGYCYRCVLPRMRARGPGRQNGTISFIVCVMHMISFDDSLSTLFAGFDGRGEEHTPLPPRHTHTEWWRHPNTII